MNQLSRDQAAVLTLHGGCNEQFVCQDLGSNSTEIVSIATGGRPA